MSYLKGGFVTLRHNKLRDITGEFLEEVCQDVAVADNNLVPSTATANDGARR